MGGGGLGTSNCDQAQILQKKKQRWQADKSTGGGDARLIKAFNDFIDKTSYVKFT